MSSIRCSSSSNLQGQDKVYHDSSPVSSSPLSSKGVTTSSKIGIFAASGLSLSDAKRVLRHSVLSSGVGASTNSRTSCSARDSPKDAAVSNLAL